MIVSATISDAKILTEIALKSKAFWGYTDQQIKSWTTDLTVSEQLIKEMIVYKFVFKTKTVGFYILNQPKEKNIELEFLFVLPHFMGNGIGGELIHHSFKKALSLGCESMTLLSDPNAVSYYQSKGFEVIGRKESSVPNRILPVLHKTLE